MKLKIVVWVMLILLNSVSVFCAEPSSSSDLPIEEIPVSLDTILRGIENRYSGKGFSARFSQKSTIKAMQITDNASGKVLIKRPGMMKWEYEAPDKQAIITDGNDLWVYRPEDNQVMVGKAPSYFKGGKGGSFLSDIRLIRQDFITTLEKTETPDYWILTLIPKEKKYDIVQIRLSISKKTFDVAQMTTTNSYGDETWIEMNEFEFNKNPPDSEFRFTIPPKTDVLKMEE